MNRGSRDDGVTFLDDGGLGESMLSNGVSNFYFVEVDISNLAVGGGKLFRTNGIRTI